MMQLKRCAACAMALCAATALFVTCVEAKGLRYIRTQNIIFMVPDGMGLADVTAARIFKNGPNGDRLAFEKWPVIGYQSTHSADSTVTEAAISMFCWAAELPKTAPPACCRILPTTISTTCWRTML